MDSVRRCANGFPYRKRARAADRARNYGNVPRTRKSNTSETRGPTAAIDVREKCECQLAARILSDMQTVSVCTQYKKGPIFLVFSHIVSMRFSQTSDETSNGYLYRG